MNKNLAAVALVLLTGCGTIKYVPEEYAIAPGRVTPLDISGTVVVENVQTDTAPIAFYEGPGAAADWVGNRKEITEHLAAQLKKELTASGRVTPGGRAKTLKVSVDRLSALQAAFHFQSSLMVVVTLGDGQKIVKHASQGSPGNMWRVLNGTIALGVIEILNDEAVRKYLSMP
jgi:hypothetical protein